MKLILSIDGGGIRGLVPAYILAELEQRYGKALPYDYVAGTSTGSILAGGLAIGLSAEKMLGFYYEDGPRIFAEPSLNHKLKSLWGQRGAKYDGQIFENILREKLGNVKLKDVNLPFLCTAYNMSFAYPTLFTNTTHPNYDLVDVIRASSAAPTYFTPKIMLENEYIDGGVFSSNPSIAALTYAKEIFKVLVPETIFLSMGTGGNPDRYENVEKWLKLKWIQPLINLMMSADNSYTHDIMESIYASVNKSTDYFRFDKKVPFDFVSSMDDASPENLDVLTSTAKKFITMNSWHIDMLLEKLSNLDN